MTIPSIKAHTTRHRKTFHQTAKLENPRNVKQSGKYSEQNAALISKATSKQDKLKAALDQSAVEMSNHKTSI